MARAPSMPTRPQVEAALALAREADPGARIKRLGPDGIEFDYPNVGAVPGGSGLSAYSAEDAARFAGKPFGAAS